MLVPPQAPGEKEALFFSLVVPTYNERENIPELVRQITSVLDRVAPADYELIIVDDSSPDGTSQVVESLFEQYPALRLVVRQDEKGLATAVVRGWQTAKGETLGVIDGDLQHPPEVLSQMLAEARKGTDLVAASRHLAQGSVAGGLTAIRKLMSRGAQYVGLVMLPEVISRVSDPMSGYFCVRRSAIAGRRLNPAGYKILVEVLSRGKIDSIAEVPYTFQPRLHGETKVRFRQFFEYLAQLVKLRVFRSTEKSD
jgi:dolichol-phosphate mannosyltransferase